MDNLIAQAQNGNIVFGLFCLITLGGAMYVLFSNHVLYAAYGLLVCFLGVAGIFVFAGAEFIAAAQIMIYIGGILVLLIFGIMLSTKKHGNHQSLLIQNENPTFTLILVSCMSLIIVLLATSISFDTSTTKPNQHIKNLGLYLMTDSVLILELIGILLLMALIGATFIAKKNE
jgi:NADH-quinone oxidoreductase subunit J